MSKKFNRLFNQLPNNTENGNPKLELAILRENSVISCCSAIKEQLQSLENLQNLIQMWYNGEELLDFENHIKALYILADIIPNNVNTVDV